MMVGKLFLGNLPWSIDDERLRSELLSAGVSCEAAEVVRDQDTGRSRGFGFARFGSSAEAADAVHKLADLVICGRPIKVDDASNNRPGPGDRRRGHDGPPISKPGKSRARRHRQDVGGRRSTFDAAWDED